MTSEVGPDPIPKAANAELPIAMPPAMPGVPADMGNRFLARLIDGGIILAILFVLGACLNPLEGQGGAIETFASLVAVIAFAGCVAYEPVMIGRYGQTVGKRLMKLHVVNADGTPAGWGPSALRYFVPVIAGCFTCNIGSFLVYISPFFDSSAWKRGWHDKIASTVVISRENSEWRW